MKILMDGLNTAAIGMGIVFMVLILLCLLIMLESKVFKIFAKKPGSGENIGKSVESVAVSEQVERHGIISGGTIIEGIDDEETLAIIYSVVSNEVEIPLTKLKFKSIKAL